LDRAIFSGGVHCLKDEKHSPAILSIELVLKFRHLRDAFFKQFLGMLFRADLCGRARIEIFEAKLLAVINAVGFRKLARPAHADAPRFKSRSVASRRRNSELVTKAALPMMKRGSIIVNNLSIAAKQVFPGSSAYNASKHGALGFTNTLREELRSKGIRVIALLPGATDTAIWNTLWPSAPRKKMIPGRN